MRDYIVERDGTIESIESVAWRQRDRLQKSLEYSKLIELVLRKRATIYSVAAATVSTFAVLSAVLIWVLASDLPPGALLSQLVKSEATWWVLFTGTLGGGTLAVLCWVRLRLIRSEERALMEARSEGHEALSTLEHALSLPKEPS